MRTSANEYYAAFVDAASLPADAGGVIQSSTALISRVAVPEQVGGRDWLAEALQVKVDSAAESSNAQKNH